jgi:hypothetical protein
MLSGFYHLSPFCRNRCETLFSRNSIAISSLAAFVVVVVVFCELEVGVNPCVGFCVLAMT